ncbi:glycoside hydrolase family 16 protein [Phenylobacterium montanum]|uniref:Glycoside hydrolase family 16 protein n=1 Tax=Phenylobacterium montanum TaxID=2823693 RepID=A0A975G0H0_9CAUL|nr:glycoside hydrolase family 16 protein [Caulobacter sp. S6]QUD88329.1 glycoside hydrolase family 16 protein [Caulobacter sp. S6]
MTQLDRSRLGHLTFSAPGHGGDWSRWARRWPWGGQGKGAWTIGDDGSLCAYAPSQVTTQKGVLCLTARPSEAKDGDAAWDMPYVSGLISSFPFFKQTYGYFEVRAQFPRGRGLHPGIALYRNPNPAIEDEIDVIETIGDDTRGAFLTLHFGSGAKDYVSQTARVFDAGAGMTTHGLLWTDKTISWFQNDQLVASTPTHAAQHAPMSLIINLGVGGNWAGAPDPRAFPARLLVEGVKAYALKA